MRFASKPELLQKIETQHEAFVDLLRQIPRSRYREEGVWGDGWTILDLLAHLTEWEQMFLGWYRAGLDGGKPALPAPGFKWNQTPALNQAIWQKHHRRSIQSVLEEFELSYAEILSLARGLSSDDLLTPGRFAWTGKHPLSTYLGPNSCSHYAVATRILKRWMKREGGCDEDSQAMDETRGGSAPDPARRKEGAGPGAHRSIKGVFLISAPMHGRWT
jgi:hypothetical protein